MADAIVSFVIQKVGDSLLGEAAFLGRVEDDVAWLRREPSMLQGFVKDAEAEQGGNDWMRQWLCNISFIERLIKRPSPVDYKIKALKERIIDLSCQRESYGLQQISNNMSGRVIVSDTIRHSRREDSAGLEDEDFVGLGDHLNNCVELLGAVTSKCFGA